MKCLLIASALTLSIVAPVMAQMAVVSEPSYMFRKMDANLKELLALQQGIMGLPTNAKSYPCVMTGPGEGDCTQAMRDMAADQANEPPLPPGIPVVSPTLQVELVSLHGVMVQMLIQQTETNQLLKAIANSPIIGADQ